MARTVVPETDTALRLVLDLGNTGMTDDQFFRLCRDNPDFRFEWTGQGELIVMAPTNPETGRKNSRITYRLAAWAEADRSGECFDSSTMFTLPNGSKRSPDASWIRNERWQALGADEKRGFSRISPDFVIELRSPSDRRADLESKMEEYIGQGVRLGWLLDTVEDRATIYRPGEEPRLVDKPGLLDGESVLPGFRFDFGEIRG